MTDLDRLRLVTLAERPDLERALNDHNMADWPPFMLQDPVADRLWHYLHEDFAAVQFMLLDEAGMIAAAANSAPLCWDGTDEGLPEGWDDQFERTAADLVAGRTPDTLGALQIVVARDHRGEGLSWRMLDTLRETARRRRYRALIACVRPTLKDRYPLMPIDEYARWRRADGLPFDPWLRVHARAGARGIRPSPRSMVIAGTVAEWHQWTGLEFPVSGPYVVPGGTNPVEVDLAEDRGVYHDANVWMIHDL